MNPTKKSFLLDVLKVTPKKKLIGKGDASVQATAAFKQYRKEEEAVIAQIKKLGEYSDPEAQKQTAAFDAEVKAALAHLESAQKGDVAQVKTKAEEALKLLQAAKTKVDAAIPTAKARTQFNDAGNLARLLLGKLKTTSTSGKQVEADNIY